jgi:DNA gyrase subunit B
VRTLDGPILRSGEARRLGQVTESLREVYGAPPRWPQGPQQLIHGPLDLLKAILDEGEKGLRCSATRAWAR